MITELQSQQKNYREFIELCKRKIHFRYLIINLPHNIQSVHSIIFLKKKEQFNFHDLSLSMSLLRGCIYFIFFFKLGTDMTETTEEEAGHTITTTEEETVDFHEDDLEIEEVTGTIETAGDTTEADLEIEAGE